MKAEKSISIKRCYANIFFMLRIAMKHTPFYFINQCLLDIYSAAEVFVEFTITMKVLLDMITNGESFYKTLRFILFILLLVMIKLIWVSVNDNYLKPKAMLKIHQKLQMNLYEHAVKLDLERYDNPEYYNEFVWSIHEADGRMDLILSDVGNFLSCITRMVVNGIFFLTFDTFGIVFVIVSLVITVVSNSAIGRMRFAMDGELKPIERKRGYFNRVFYLKDYAKELRLNPVGGMLREEFKETNQKIYPLVKKYGWKMAVVAFVSSFVANDIFMNVFYLGYLVYMTVEQNAFTYGSAMALFWASSSLKGALRNLAVLFPKFEQHGLYVEKIRTFLAYESNMPSGHIRIKGEDFKELTVSDISFAYGAQSETLKNISLSVKAGEKVAIVGYNGAGKTTLIKLMMRLYDVKGGSIKVNGRDIGEYDISDYRGLFASVFQDYKIFASDLKSNVKADIVTKEEYPDILRALEESGLSKKVESLKLGMDTPLTREFDEEGVDLSGGEAQKAAIARTFFKYCPVIILDEPSSALDPVSEYNLNQTMAKAAKNKAVIFISHRLSSTLMADRIYMLENGYVIEEGSHENLMRQNGKYAEMFRLQAEKYK